MIATIGCPNYDEVTKTLEVKNSENYVVIASLDCQYDFWVYELNEFRYRTRVRCESFPIRVAIKTK